MQNEKTCKHNTVRWYLSPKGNEIVKQCAQCDKILDILDDELGNTDEDELDESADHINSI